MVVHFKKAATVDEAGYYSGLLAGAFMGARAFTAFAWGDLSDRIGRKPVLVIGISAMAAFQLMFGLSTSFEMALAARLLLGAFNGIVGTAKTAAAELVHSSQQAKAMSFLSGWSVIGQIIGPSVGGLLSEPRSSYPDVDFGPVLGPLLERFPFLLPNLVAVVLSMASLLGVVCFLPETLERQDGGGGIWICGGRCGVGGGVGHGAAQVVCAGGGGDVEGAHRVGGNGCSGGGGGVGGGNSGVIGSDDNVDGDGGSEVGYREEEDNDELPLTVAYRGTARRELNTDDGDSTGGADGAASGDDSTTMASIADRTSTYDSTTMASIADRTPTYRATVRMTRTKRAKVKTKTKRRGGYMAVVPVEREEDGGEGGDGGGVGGGGDSTIDNNAIAAKRTGIRARENSADGGLQQDEISEHSLRRRRGDRQGCCSRVCRAATNSKLGGICADRVVMKVIALYVCYGLQSMWFSDIFPLWCMASLHVGGFGLGPVSIGATISVAAVSLFLYQLCVFPRIAKRVKLTNFLLCAEGSLVVFFFVAPFASNVVGLTEWHGAPLHGGNGEVKNASSMSTSSSSNVSSNATIDHAGPPMAILATVTILRTIQIILSASGFTVCNVLTNTAASPSSRGAVNGLAMALASIAKAIGPVIGSESFAWSVNSGLSAPFDYHFSFWGLSVWASFVALFAFCTIPRHLNDQSRNKR